MLELLIAVYILWLIAGLVAFIMSLVCFGYNGTTSEKFLGLMIALFIGPFYWIYYAYNSSYCYK